MNGHVRRPTKARVVSDFRRGQILDAARRTFARQGLEGTTVDHIAREARVAKGTVYLYYRSKDDLLRHAIDASVASLRLETVPAIAGPGPIDERLRRFVQALLVHFDRERSFIDLCQIELGAELRHSARAKFGRLYAAQTTAWRAALTGARRQGTIRSVQTAQAAQAIVAFAHGLAIQRLRGWNDQSIDADAAEAAALLWKGLAAR